MSSEKGQKHIYAQEHQMYYYYNDFKGQLLYKKMKNDHATVYALDQRAKMYFSPANLSF
jgi:hypothetical protein